jgi:hypothetical protein
MADLVIGTVEISSALTRSDLDVKQVGQATSIGDVLYLDSSDSKYKLADADASGTAAATHLALSAASADADVDLQIDLGAALTVGTTYVVSATAGKIAPESDLLSGDYVTHLGVASTAALLDIKLNVTGVAKP